MGRPREFDVVAAVDRAMKAFWTRGYETISLADLCDVSCCGRSTATSSNGTLSLSAILAQSLPVRDFFATRRRQFSDQIVSGAGRRGCFLGNCAAELPRHDRVALTRVREGLARDEAISAR
ncbi:MAG: hypothetical protein AB7S93_26850 [Xanthobacteraceae bacterium]